MHEWALPIEAKPGFTSRVVRGKRGWEFHRQATDTPVLVTYCVSRDEAENYKAKSDDYATKIDG